MKQLGLVMVAALVVVMVASCSFKAQMGNPKDLGTDESGKTATSGTDAKTAAPAAPAAAEGGPKVVVLDIGDQRDEKSKDVTHQTREFKPETPIMFVNVGVKGLTAGQLVKGTLQAIDVKTKSGQELRDTKAASAELKAPGETSTFNFRFSVPTKGWPVGKYEVRFSTGGKVFESDAIAVK